MEFRRCAPSSSHSSILRQHAAVEQQFWLWLEFRACLCARGAPDSSHSIVPDHAAGHLISIRRAPAGNFCEYPKGELLVWLRMAQYAKWGLQNEAFQSCTLGCAVRRSFNSKPARRWLGNVRPNSRRLSCLLSSEKSQVHGVYKSCPMLFEVSERGATKARGV